MKHSHKLAISAVSTIAVAVTLLASIAADPSIPVGSLDAYPTKVQPGTKPTLSWDITHPTEDITEIVNIVPPGKLIPQEDLFMDVRVLGASVQAGAGNWLPVQARVSVNGGSWTTFFYNSQPNVNPTQVYFTQEISEGQIVDFGGRYNWSGWGPFYNTTQTTSNVIALVNGDEPPSYVPAYNQGNIEAFLDPYIDSDGKISIGPLDIIYLYEVGTSNTNSSAFDMQDLVLLVTFRRE